jgi:hypothetical protein
MLFFGQVEVFSGTERIDIEKNGKFVRRRRRHRPSSVGVFYLLSLSIMD